MNFHAETTIFHATKNAQTKAERRDRRIAQEFRGGFDRKTARELFRQKKGPVVATGRSQA